MLIGSGEHTYEWVENWAKIPDSESARTGWAHPGIVASESGLVATFHQADPTVMLFEADGTLHDSWEADVSNGHGMALVKEDDTEYIWLADNNTGGETVMSIDKPDFPIYEEGKYSPTSMTVFEERQGGNGDIWISDGYGQFYVHRYTKSGEYVASINGEEGDTGRIF